MKYTLRYDDKNQVLLIVDRTDNAEYKLVGIKAYMLYMRIQGVLHYAGLEAPTLIKIAERQIKNEIERLTKI